MSRRIKHRPETKYIRQRTGQNPIPAPAATFKAKDREHHSGQKQAQQNHPVIIQMHETHRHQYRKKCKRIANHIIMKRLQYIAPFPDTKIPFRYDQPMAAYQLQNDCTQIPCVINKRLKMLHPAVSIPDKCPSSSKIPAVHNHCRNRKHKRIA